MFLTLEILRERKACEAGIKYVERFYPNGAELSTLIADKHIPFDFLHWGWMYLDPSEEEIRQYEQRVGISNTTSYYRIENVSDSSFIDESKFVARSHHVVHSQNVNDSNFVYSSHDVENSNRVTNSAYIYNSTAVVGSANITNTSQVFNSQAIIDCETVIASMVASNCDMIYDCAQVEDLHFCSSCKNLTHGLFCFQPEDGAKGPLLFNKPVSEKMYENALAQYKKLKVDFAPIECIKGEETCALNRDFKGYFARVPSRFWDWMRTLPNFDTEIAYSLTFHDEFL